MTVVAGRESADVTLVGLLAVAAANGWAARLLAADAPSVSLFAPLALFVAIEPLLRRPPAPLGPVPVALAAGLILVPSGALAWVAMAFVAVWARMAGRSRGLLLLLAACELLVSVGLNRIKATLLPLEASLAAMLLNASGVAAETAGNVVLVGGRMTIVAVGCSGLGGALFAGLATLAVLVWRGTGVRPAAASVASAAAAATAFLANSLRIATMATDAVLYDLAHGRAGAFATDIAASAGVVLAVLAAERMRR